MLAAIIGVKQLSRLGRSRLWNRHDARRRRFHYSIDLVVAVECETNLRVEKTNHR